MHIKREKPYDVASAQPSTSKRGMALSSSSANSPKQSSPGRMVNAKTKNLPRFKAKINSAIKAKQATRAGAPSAELERNYMLSCIGRHWIRFAAGRTYGAFVLILLLPRECSEASGRDLRLSGMVRLMCGSIREKAKLSWWPSPVPVAGLCRPHYRGNTSSA